MTTTDRDMFVDNGDVTLRVEVAGDGPTIVCVHGWPELPHSWRHQVEHFARRGFTVAALEVRGYGASSSPTEVERYTLAELAGDVAAVARALSDEPVVLFGHDWGAPIAWHTAIRHPELVRGVAGLSVPHTPPAPFSLLDVFDQLYADRFFYMLSFQEPGVVEAEFEADVRTALRRVYHAGSAGATVSLLPDGPRGATLLSLLPDPPPGPLGFMTDDDLDTYVSAFEHSGFRGPFNRYRAVALEPQATADIMGATVDRPACFIGGEHDLVRAMVPGADLFADPGAGCTDFRGTTIVPGAGHWVQQEAPTEVNAALDAFVDGL
jgi:pimeloyl-ACP methyl ester carboxylesterase